MRRTLIIMIAIVFLAILLAYTATFSVRFTESGVLTTFGRATEADVKRDAGLYFKWPYPIQSVTKYDTRIRVTPAKLEQQQTKDDQAITVEAFACWRVVDPLKFFQRFSNAGGRPDEHYALAEGVLKSNLRAALAQVSRYSMGQLFNAQPNASKLPELEATVLASLKSGDEKGVSLKDYGIEATSVGISRIVLPESVTTAVFDAMKSRRTKLAQDTESRGQAEAATVKEAGERDANRIKYFADRRAKEIKTLGDLESAQFLKQMGQNPELANFLIAMDSIRAMQGKRITMVLSSTLPGMRLFFPDALERLKPGEIPSIAPDQPRSPAKAEAPR